MISEAISYTVDARLSVPGVDVEIHTFRQPEPFTGILKVDAHTLSMSLTPQVSYSRGHYFDPDGQPGPWAQMGDITFSPRGTQLMVVAPGGAESYRGIYLSFDPAVFAETTEFRGDWSNQQLAAALNVQAPMMKRDLYRIVKEVSESGFCREKMVEIAAQLVLVELARYLRQASEQYVPPVRTSLAGWQMRRITDYVEGMIDHSPTIDELARVCEIGRRHLTRAFKATTGRTIGEYVTEVRMTKAKSLLADTNLSQKEIAYRLGFSGPSSFCVTFGKAEGITPKQFRGEHKRS